MVSILDVDTAIAESLDCLKEKEYEIRREQRGENIYYTVYKNGSFIGTWRIKPGGPGGSIQCTDDPELVKEWDFIWKKLIFNTLETRFGKLPWDKQDQQLMESKKREPNLDELKNMPDIERKQMKWCVRWANRMPHSAIKNLDEFLVEVGYDADLAFITKDIFKKWLQEAGKLGLIRKAKNKRWVPNCDVKEIMKL